MPSEASYSQSLSIHYPLQALHDLCVSCHLCPPQHELYTNRVTESAWHYIPGT